MPVPVVLALPPYPGDRIGIPSYTAQPSLGEESLSRSATGHAPPSGEHVTSSGKISLTFKNQFPDVLVPTFAPNELISGTIRVQSPESVTEVVLKVAGRMDLAGIHGTRRQELVRESYTVWHNNLRHMCPPSIPFSFIFPSTFTEEESGASCALPPSILVKPSERPFLYIKFSLWRGEKILDVPVHIHPRACPLRPIMPNPSLLATVKSAPEEWHQVLCTLGPKVLSRGIHCSLFIPSSQTYGLQDIISFHLQVNGPVNMLRRLVTTERATSPTPSSPSSPSSPSFRSRSPRIPAQSAPTHPIRVYLLRQINLVVRGEHITRNIPLGEGVLTTLPPPISSVAPTNSAQIDWGGEISVKTDVDRWDNDGSCKGVLIESISTFDSGPLWLKDFIVVSIPQWDVEHRHSITFVSDTWIDDVGPGDRVRVVVGSTISNSFKEVTLKVTKLVCFNAPCVEQQMPFVQITFEDQLASTGKSSFQAGRLRLPQHDAQFRPIPTDVEELRISRNALYKNRIGDGSRCRIDLEELCEWGREGDEFEPIYVEACATNGMRFYLRLFLNAQNSLHDRSFETYEMYEKVVRDAKFHSLHLGPVEGHIVPRHHGLWLMDTGLWAGRVIFTILQWCGLPYAEIIREKQDSEMIKVFVGRAYELLHDYGVVHGGDDDPFDKVMFDLDHHEATGILKCYIAGFSEAQSGHICKRKVPILPLGCFVPSKTVGCREIGGILCILHFSVDRPDGSDETTVEVALKWHKKYRKEHPGVSNVLALYAQRAKLYSKWPPLYYGAYELVDPDNAYPQVVPVYGDRMPSSSTNDSH
ncbi:hypothetical protein MIND_00824700 [Mycena indigotica]|uniref:Uncharacterized protein n=1 Tax=Mycena indigotica TaxID=2126181 RepID=A0A8H6W0Q5_9AGAR|nr:uncharacterized protein MIND_00824700 [Mycena indigotica]KAF7298771.1 hypothetical protein MIND_00824700 [Mycena indigotica]